MDRVPLLVDGQPRLAALDLLVLSSSTNTHVPKLEGFVKVMDPLRLTFVGNHSIRGLKIAGAVAGSRLSRMTFVNSSWEASDAQLELTKQDFDLVYVFRLSSNMSNPLESSLLWRRSTTRDLRKLIRFARVPQKVEIWVGTEHEVSEVVLLLKSVILSGKSVWERLGSRLTVAC